MRLLILAPLLLLGTSPSIFAQDSDYLFTVDSQATLFNWDLTAAIGNIVETPPTFTVDGAATGMPGESASGALVSGLLAGGGVLRCPDLFFQIPNPIPFLPDLANGSVVGMEIRVQSGPFSVDPTTGDFTAIIEMVPFAGIATWSGILGSGNSLMAGSSSGPILSNGRLIRNGSDIIMELPFDASIPFPLGINGRLWGTLYAVANSNLPNIPVLETALGLALGIWDNFTVRNANPGGPVGLGVSMTGMGSPPVLPWGVALDIDSAFQVGNILLADPNGTATWSLYIPPHLPMWKSVWIQAAMPGATTNVSGNFTY